MKKIVSTLAVMSVMAVAGISSASASWYGSAKGSLSFENQDHSVKAFGTTGSSPYTPTINLGKDASTDRNDSMGSLKLAIGAKVWQKEAWVIRVEAEKGFFTEQRTNEFDAMNEYGNNGKTLTNVQPTLSTQHDTWFANAYIDYRLTDRIYPFVGAGIGIDTMNASYSRQSGRYYINENGTTETNFAWNVQAGIAYRLTDYVTLDLSYRYSDLGKTSLEYFQHVDTGATHYPNEFIKHDIKSSLNEVLFGFRSSF
jgi:opacity protein-like surface antigen